MHLHQQHWSARFKAGRVAYGEFAGAGVDGCDGGVAVDYAGNRGALGERCEELTKGKQANEKCFPEMPAEIVHAESVYG